MGRRKPASRIEFAMFDVLYEDGSITSNRKVPGAALEGLDEEASVRAAIETQDREIAQRSGRPRPRIKSITRSKSG